jgi:hypothetical protein
MRKIVILLTFAGLTGTAPLLGRAHAEPIQAGEIAPTAGMLAQARTVIPPEGPGVDGGPDPRLFGGGSILD